MAPAFFLPHRSRKRISSRARASNIVEFEVNFSRGVKNTGYLFPKMVLFEGPRPSKSLSMLSNPFPRPSKSSKSEPFRGSQTLLREEIDRGWGGQSAPLRTSFPWTKKLRLVDFGKKWRLPLRLCPVKQAKSVHLPEFYFHTEDLSSPCPQFQLWQVVVLLVLSAKLD